MRCEEAVGEPRLAHWVVGDAWFEVRHGGEEGFGGQAGEAQGGFDESGELRLVRLVLGRIGVDDERWTSSVEEMKGRRAHENTFTSPWAGSSLTSLPPRYVCRAGTETSSHEGSTTAVSVRP